MRGKGRLSHVDRSGKARMVDVSGKQTTLREARAEAEVEMAPGTLELLRKDAMPKGSVIETVRLAGIMASKRTADLIPLCHPLALSHVDVEVQLLPDGVRIEAVARTLAGTGVEMEAMMAVSVAALTLYDMCKAVEKGMTIRSVRLLEKRGGKSGHWRRA